MDRRRFLTSISAGGASLLGGGSLLALGRRARPNDRVLVIGAGMSGLAAAQMLKTRLGFTAPGQVVVLEGRARVGGRIHSDRSLGVSVDMGATWIHGVNGNPITKLANRFGLARRPSDYASRDLHDLSGQLLPKAIVNSAENKVWLSLGLAWAYGRLLPNDQPMSRSLDAVGTPGRFAANERVAAELGFAGVVDEASQYLQHYSSKSDGGSSFGGGDVLFPGGLDEVTSGVASGVDVRLQEIVQEVDTTGSVATVTTDRGVHRAERVIVTLPLGVLKAGSVDFRPGLRTTIQQAISTLGFGRRHRLVLEFPFVFWNDQVEFLGKAGVAHGDYGAGEHLFFVNRSPVSGRPILTTESTGRMADRLERMSPRQAADRVMLDLRAMYGAHAPAPTRVLSSGWGGSPFTGGSYSGWVVGAQRRDNDRFLSTGDDRLFFAGEHTIGEYHATIHGAFLSGVRAAQRLAAVAS